MDFLQRKKAEAKDIQSMVETRSITWKSYQKTRSSASAMA